MHTPCVILQDSGGEKFQAFGVAERRTGGGEMLPTLVVDRQASAMRDKEAECFHEVAGVSIVTVSGWSMVDTFNHREPSGLNKL